MSLVEGMRRKERALGLRDTLEVLQRCEVCRVALCDGDVPYIVPMNFGIKRAGEEILLYFHCAQEGRKTDLLRQNPRIGFEADRPLGLVIGDIPCQFSMEYESVIGTGMGQILIGREEKREGLGLLMARYAKEPEEGFYFSEAHLDRVCVWRVTVESISGKRHQRHRHK